jgi:hypothetical protein
MEDEVQDGADPATLTFCQRQLLSNDPRLNAFQPLLSVKDSRSLLSPRARQKHSAFQGWEAACISESNLLEGPGFSSQLWFWLYDLGQAPVIYKTGRAMTSSHNKGT